MTIKRDPYAESADLAGMSAALAQPYSMWMTANQAVIYFHQQHSRRSVYRALRELALRGLCDGDIMDIGGGRRLYRTYLVVQLFGDVIEHHE